MVSDSQWTSESVVGRSRQMALMSCRSPRRAANVADVMYGVAIGVMLKTFRRAFVALFAFVGFSALARSSFATRTRSSPVRSVFGFERNGRPRSSLNFVNAIAASSRLVSERAVRIVGRLAWGGPDRKSTRL